MTQCHSQNPFLLEHKEYFVGQQNLCLSVETRVTSPVGVDIEFDDEFDFEDNFLNNQVINSVDDC